MSAWIGRRTTTGSAWAAGAMRVTPEAQVITLRLPVGSFVWNRPTGVVVQQAGRTRLVPIVDITRLVEMALWTGAVAWLVGCVWAHKRKKED